VRCSQHPKWHHLRQAVPLLLCRLPPTRWWLLLPNSCRGRHAHAFDMWGLRSFSMIMAPPAIACGPLGLRPVSPAVLVCAAPRGVRLGASLGMTDAVASRTVSRG